VARSQRRQPAKAGRASQPWKTVARPLTPETPRAAGRGARADQAGRNGIDVIVEDNKARTAHGISRGRQGHVAAIQVLVIVCDRHATPPAGGHSLIQVQHSQRARPLALDLIE
jgi:hypothetical protein